MEVHKQQAGNIPGEHAPRGAFGDQGLFLKKPPLDPEKTFILIRFLYILIRSLFHSTSHSFKIGYVIND
jgi:hypothetical protein